MLSHIHIPPSRHTMPMEHAPTTRTHTIPTTHHQNTPPPRHPGDPPNESTSDSVVGAGAGPGPVTEPLPAAPLAPNPELAGPDRTTSQVVANTNHSTAPHFTTTNAPSEIMDVDSPSVAGGGGGGAVEGSEEHREGTTDRTTMTVEEQNGDDHHHGDSDVDMEVDGESSPSSSSTLDEDGHEEGGQHYPQHSSTTTTTAAAGSGKGKATTSSSSALPNRSGAPRFNGDRATPSDTVADAPLGHKRRSDSRDITDFAELDPDLYGLRRSVSAISGVVVLIPRGGLSVGSCQITTLGGC